LTSREKAERLKKYSLEEQYDLYLYFMRVEHPPPASDLKDSITEPGPAVAPFLKKKLEDAKEYEKDIENGFIEEDIEVGLIIELFHTMAWMERYDFSKDPELVKLIKRKANGMPDSPYKEFVLRFVSEIPLEVQENLPAPREAKELLMLPLPEQKMQIIKYSYSSQYEVLEYFKHIQHPSYGKLVASVAGQGEELVSFFKITLMGRRNIEQIAVLTDVFYEASKQRTYDFSWDTEFILLMEQKANSVNEGELKEYILGRVAEIKKRRTDNNSLHELPPN